MRRSFVKLIVTAVLLCWGLGYSVLYVFAHNLSWDREDARRAGVYWLSDVFDGASSAERSALTARAEGQFPFRFQVVPVERAEARIGRRLAPGERALYEAGTREHWFYAAFADAGAALEIGPIDPAVPEGVFPIGVILAIVVTPLVAVFVAARIAVQLRKVEQATEELGAGVLSTRVDNQGGPSHELAASFNSMAERIEQLVRDRDELVQAVSHELGSPLSRLRFHLELLGNASDEAQRRSRIDAAERELDELDELIVELLRWVQSGEGGLDIGRFDAVKPLADLTELAQFHRRATEGVRVVTNLPAQAWIEADARQFQRVVENLLRNAVKYAASTVRLTLTSDGSERVAITVEDDGPGIPEADRARVLEPFTRLDADRARQTGGAGLGLAIVDRIVRQHHGELSIGDSELGGAAIATRWRAAGPGAGDD